MLIGLAFPMDVFGTINGITEIFSTISGILLTFLNKGTVFADPICNEFLSVLITQEQWYVVFGCFGFGLVLCLLATVSTMMLIISKTTSLWKYDDYRQSLVSR